MTETITVGSLAIRAMFDCDYDINTQTVSYGEFYKIISDLKKADNLEIVSSEGKLSINGNDMVSNASSSGDTIWTELETFDFDVFNKAIPINAVAAKSGYLDCNKYLFFLSENNKCHILNTNDILLNDCKLDSSESFCFGINQEDCNVLKKFLAANSNKSINALDVKLFVNDTKTYVKFQMTSKNNVVYEMIIQSLFGERIEHLANVLLRLISTNWSGKEIQINEDLMRIDSITDSYTEYLANPKYSGKEKNQAKKLFKEFLDDKNLKDAYKKALKTFEVNFLNLSSSLGEDLYILRTLYESFKVAISSHSTKSYLLDTKAKALVFEYEDEMFSFKSLFMLKVPVKEIVDLTDEEFEEEDDTPVEETIEN